MAISNMQKTQLMFQVKTALRLSSVTFDADELSPMIDACLSDMHGAGVDVEQNNFLLRQAVVFFCKANFGLEHNDKWQARYEETRNALASRTAAQEGST